MTNLSNRNQGDVGPRGAEESDDPSPRTRLFNCSETTALEAVTPAETATPHRGASYGVLQMDVRVIPTELQQPQKEHFTFDKLIHLQGA